MYIMTKIYLRSSPFGWQHNKKVVKLKFLSIFNVQVDETGGHIAGGGFWGHCAKNCPGAAQAPTSQQVLDEQKKIQEELKVGN